MEIKYITIKNEREIIRIRIRELLYITVDGTLVSCHVEDGEIFCCSASLRSLVEKLPNDFVLINRSCLVNAEKVRRFHRQKRILTLIDASTHQVSARKVKDLTDKLG
jgi:DNA-binding LytR/AlgR family response regulator